MSSLEEAQKSIRTADHLVYITFPLVKDKQVIVAALINLGKAVSHILDIMLSYERTYKKTSYLSERTSENDITYLKSCFKRFSLNEQDLEKMLQLLAVLQKRNSHSIEFMRDEKLVIVSGNLSTESLTADILKEYILTLKSVLRKIELVIKTKI